MVEWERSEVDPNQRNVPTDPGTYGLFGDNLPRILLLFCPLCHVGRTPIPLAPARRLLLHSRPLLFPRQGGRRCCRSGRFAENCSLGLGLLVLVVSILSSTGLVATYAYRNLVNSLSWRVSELPLAAELSRHVSDLRITIGELRGPRLNTFLDNRRDPASMRMVREQFCSQLDEVDQTLVRYRNQLSSEARADASISDHEREEETVHKIEDQLERIRTANRDEDWMLDNLKSIGSTWNSSGCKCWRRICPATCTRSWPASPTRFGGNTPR